MMYLVPWILRDICWLPINSLGSRASTRVYQVVNMADIDIPPVIGRLLAIEMTFDFCICCMIQA
jgi:hypothetical protein